MSDDVTLGELARRVDRMDREMQAGFAGLHEKIDRLAFVPAAVYAADQASYLERQSAQVDRIKRIEADLLGEEAARKAAEDRADQRGWHVRVALGVAMFGAFLSVISAVVTAAVAS